MTERVIVYSGQVPLETDILRTNKNMMISISKLAASIFGTSTIINGLSCSPSSPASLNVLVSPGEMYSLANIDGTPYSSLSADTTHTILKQGVLLDSTTLAITPPTTAGFSINYLVQFSFQEVDTDSITLAYYNAANPSQAWSGPGGLGAAQYTTRSGTVSISLKPGIAAATGSQSTPSADTGYTAAWVVTVANGQTAINSSSISRVVNAPFMPSTGILKSIQSGEMQFGTDSGSANAYSVRLTPGVTALSDGMRISFRPANSNSGSSTLNVSGLGSQPLVNAYGAALISGELSSSSIATVMWNATLSSWMLMSSTSAFPTVPTASAGTSTKQAASTEFVGTAITNAHGRLLNTQVFTANGTMTKTTGATKWKIKCLGAGAGSSASPATSAGQVSISNGGGAGAYAEGIYDVTSITSLAVTVGTGGTAGTSSSIYGGDGGASSVGSLITSPGGKAGQPAGPATPPFQPVANTNSDGPTGWTIIGTSGPGAEAAVAVATSYAAGSRGANSQLGVGGSVPAINTPANIGGGYGSGASGCSNGPSQSANAGAAGRGGLVIIEEYS